MYTSKQDKSETAADRMKCASLHLRLSDAPSAVGLSGNYLNLVTTAGKLLDDSQSLVPVRVDTTRENDKFGLTAVGRKYRDG